tara:strand:- start:72 stop:299 length:228 start_codon:yes stop_codon:yes gene_type:complete
MNIDFKTLIPVAAAGLVTLHLVSKYNSYICPWKIANNNTCETKSKDDKIIPLDNVNTENNVHTDNNVHTENNESI